MPPILYSSLGTGKALVQFFLYAAWLIKVYDEVGLRDEKCACCDNVAGDHMLSLSCDHQADTDHRTSNFTFPIHHTTTCLLNTCI